MEYNNTLIKFAAKVKEKKHSCATEEATKHSLILPFIQILGYDIFDPTEVVPEVDCDLKHTGERIDYIVERDGRHQILIECKHWKQNLDKHVMQLGAYFAASDARIGILTNGVEYRFFTDLEKVNLMDEKPFLVVDMENLKETDVDWLCEFRKGSFNAVRITDKALQQVRLQKLKSLVADELSDPSIAFTRHFARMIFPSSPNTKAVEAIRPLLVKAIGEVTGKTPAPIPGVPDDETELLKAVTTALNGIVSPDRIVWKENQQYSTVRLDGSEWRPICRIKYTKWAKWIMVTHWDASTERLSQGERHVLSSPSDIANHSDELQQIVKQMLTWD